MAAPLSTVSLRATPLFGPPPAANTTASAPFTTWLTSSTPASSRSRTTHSAPVASTSSLWSGLRTMPTGSSPRSASAFSSSSAIWPCPPAMTTRMRLLPAVGCLTWRNPEGTRGIPVPDNLRVMSRNVALVTDSTSMLTAETVVKRDLTVVPLQVVVGTTPYDEGVDADATPTMIAQALRAGTSVSTSRPTPAVFLETYQRAAEAGATEVLSIHLSAEMSGTWESAV